MIAKPTPLPWRAVGAEVRADERSKVADCDNHIPYVRDGEGEANAALIARAVNAHADLLAACEGIVAVFTATSRPDFDAFADAVRACLAAVGKAKAGAP